MWALVFLVFCAFLYNRNRFGVRVHVTGDNSDAAQQMGINIRPVRSQCHIFMGIGSALASIFGVLINFTWYPISGDGYLLPTLASVFVGGTAPWGGVGAIIGSLTVSFIQTGVVGVGLSPASTPSSSKGSSSSFPSSDIVGTKSVTDSASRWVGGDRLER